MRGIDGRSGFGVGPARRAWLAVVTAMLLAFGLMATAAPAGAGDDGLPEPKVTLCHAAGLEGTTHYITLTVGHSAAYGPAGHFEENGTTRAGHEQDYLGECVDEPDEPVVVELKLTSMCQLGDDHVWRVENGTSYSVPFEVVLGAGPDGTAEPGWTYFLGAKETTKIAWGGEGTGFVADDTTKAANNEVCAYEVELVKDWDGEDAPEGGPFVTLTVDKDDAVGADEINEGGKVEVLPGGSFVVTEDVPAGWKTVAGVGEFTVPEWPGPEVFFGTYDPRFGGADKFVTHRLQRRRQTRR